MKELLTQIVGSILIATPMGLVLLIGLLSMFYRAFRHGRNRRLKRADAWEPEDAKWENIASMEESE